MDRHQLRTAVGGAYDLQKLRIQMGNRIAGNFRAKLGQEPGKKLEDEDAQRVIDVLKANYRKLMDGVKTFPTKRSFAGNEVISTHAELCLLDMYLDIERDEAKHFRRLEKMLEEFSIWPWLKGVRGCGVAMAGVIVAYLDPARARHVSSFWRYCGLDVAGDGRGRSRRKEHLVETAYTNAAGEADTKMGLSFNPFVKTKLAGVLGGSFLKCGSPYREHYDAYRHRMEQHAVYGTAHDGIKDAAGRPVTSKLRRHNMAIRYMVKRFLADLWAEWRRLEGLPVTPEYHEARLGHDHHRERMTG